MKECPCKLCTFETGRSPGCHSKCRKYLEWKVEHDKEVEQEKASRSQYYSTRTGGWYKTREGNWRNIHINRRRKK